MAIRLSLRESPPEELPATEATWVRKSDEQLQIVWGEVYVPDFPDSDGDFMSATEIRKMEMGFMKHKLQDSVDKQHSNILEEGCCVVESFITRKGDPDFPIEGSWVVGMHIESPALWEEVMSGELNGFSMQAKVKSRPKVLELEVPDRIVGKTEATNAQEDVHLHSFAVSFSEDGEFRGGETSPHGSDQHKHQILGGSVTQAAGSPPHTHRYSFMDSLVRE